MVGVGGAIRDRSAKESCSSGGGEPGARVGGLSRRGSQSIETSEDPLAVDGRRELDSSEGQASELASLGRCRRGWFIIIVSSG